MNEPFEEMLSVGGKKNTLGRANDVVNAVLADKPRLEELYQCMFSEDAWVRMRAADAFEKLGREYPDWLMAYIDRLQSDLSKSRQPSIQWHLAQIYKQIDLNSDQRRRAIAWLEKLISTVDVDWIVAANTMETLAHFTKTGYFNRSKLLALLAVQARHKSNSVVKKSIKIAKGFS